MQTLFLDQLRAQLRASKLDHYEEILLPHARLAFDLRLEGESTGEIGEGRWGGLPDVAPGFEWPLGETKTPLLFLAQINLADLVADAENPFPPRGLLQFFADLEDDKAQIVIVSADGALERAEAPEDAFEDDDRPPHRLLIEARADLPQWATSDYHDLTSAMSEAEQDAYCAIFNVTEGKKDRFAGQLLGHAAGIGSDPRENAFAFKEHGVVSYRERKQLDMSGAAHWRNLAVFDSVMALNFCVGDAGYFGFLIHEKDLKTLDFSRVYAHLQSS